jgi:uncharacterized protein (DUF58 family)
MEKCTLNLDIDEKINEFKSMLKEFGLKRKKVVFRGKGLEFDGYRDFTQDDDAKEIDWKSSSRAQKLLVKQYKEERDLKIVFLIDVGTNMVSGSTEKIKCEFATELIAALADLIIHSEDRIGFLLFNDVINPFVECKGGDKHFQFFMDILSDCSNYGGKSSLDKALDFAINSFDNSIFSVIIVSDFLNITKETESKLGLLAYRFETIAIQIRDPLDITLPEINGEVVIESPLTSQQIIVNPKIMKNVYEKYTSEQERVLKQIFEKSGVDYLSLTTDKSFAPPLAMFLKEREESV